MNIVAYTYTFFKKGKDVMISRTFWNSSTLAFLDKNILECQFANLYYYPKRYVSLYK